MHQGRHALLIIALGLAGCGSATPTTNVDTTRAETPAAPAHATMATAPAPVQASPNYDEHDGSLYRYIAAVSDEDKAKGVAAGSVSTFRYLGKQGGKYVLESVGDDGSTLARNECAEPCRILVRHYGSSVSRLAYDPSSVIGAAFEDAIAGRLVPAPSATRATSSAAAKPPTIPAAFLGLWNDDLAQCGTGESDTELRIRPSVMNFYESVMTVKVVVVHSPRSVTVAGDSAGEGERWATSYEMVLSGSGNGLTIDGFTRHRCPS